ncbi:MAG: hypothetical protein Athens101428_308 [Candidatus Berkelbacteria bacterium Athens1014_28]|uniref:Uncharacterized protein n=1 Tax=Candidatus Berkelbacteria bacterium Athens1014_28 TaxID=2017145 RepID=A0A554LN94_9BACT|nr:MAG: hypothetical protein Athens101428_308 [Candidatus Berkelbacteria bacterium Athens1014_28]
MLSEFENPIGVEISPEDEKFIRELAGRMSADIDLELEKSKKIHAADIQASFNSGNVVGGDIQLHNDNVIVRQEDLRNTFKQIAENEIPLDQGDLAMMETYLEVLAKRKPEYGSESQRVTQLLKSIKTSTSIDESQ